MKDYRIVFEKRGRVKYISHLDLNRCMLRAVRRSGLPAWYTEGFHPHMYLMFPLALSLGAESICEVMDLRLTEEVQPEEILARLNPALPEGLKAYEVREPKHATQDVGSAEYEVTLTGERLPELVLTLSCDRLQRLGSHHQGVAHRHAYCFRAVIQPHQCFHIFSCTTK